MKKNKNIKELEDNIVQYVINQKSIQQRLYEILICILIFLPIISTPILGVLGKTAGGIIILIICFLLIPIASSIRKKSILSSFYKVKDAHKNCNIIKVNDLSLLEKMYNESTLATMSAENLIEPSYLDIMYNWLNNLGTIKNEKLDFYTFTGKAIKEKYGFDIDNKINVVCIPLTQLNIIDEKKISEQQFMFKTRYFDDIIESYMANRTKKQKFYNIYTGEEVKDKFESLGYYKYSDANKKIHLQYNGQEKIFDYSTNTEYSYNDLKFIICRINKENLIILFNVYMKENSEHGQLRESFADSWTYFKSAYSFNINETLEFEYESNKIKIFINSI